MTRFWCTWCGAVAESDERADDVACVRCTHEFCRLFGFFPRTSMMPLADGEEPGEPASARKQFTVRDARTGRLRGRTRIAARGDSPAAREGVGTA